MIGFPFQNTMIVTGWYILSIVLSIVVFIGISLILRHFWCWYIKMNRVVSLLEEQNRLLTQITDDNKAIFAANQRYASRQSPPQPPPDPQPPIF